MHTSLTPLHPLVKRWLFDEALPRWVNHGVDWKNGGFYEELSLQGEGLDVPKRTRVQFRQIYSFKVAYDLGYADSKLLLKAIQHGVDFIFSYCALPTGAFIHSVDADGQPKQTVDDLYTQAFSLFGLASLYQCFKKPEFLERAKKLLLYLQSERRLPEGGYSEKRDKAIVFEANPHMHLFEACMAWMRLDQDPIWCRVANEILELCLSAWIQRSNGFLCEKFQSHWRPISFPDMGHIFEPGHHFEWSWLMGQYQRFHPHQKDLDSVRQKLFDLGETYGICPQRGSVFDAVWSQGVPHLKSSRLWPQCERIKAALALGKKDLADQALKILFCYFKTPVQSSFGLWRDTWLETGDFDSSSVKASSFYHIIGALSEYLTLSV